MGLKELSTTYSHRNFDGALGIALFFSTFLSASSDPFVRNFFVRTEPLAESNPVPQDPISAIHPPCIYAGDVASAMGFGLCRSQMKNGIVLHSQSIRAKRMVLLLDDHPFPVYYTTLCRWNRSTSGS